MSTVLSLSEAKAKFSEVVERASLGEDIIMGIIYMTKHQSPVYRSASCPGNPATCGS